MFKHFLRWATLAKPPRTVRSRSVKLNAEQLPDLVMPALWAVGMTSPWTGSPGDTAATISGPLSYASQWPLNESGAAIVEAASASEAVSRAFAGGITVHCGAETLNYQMGPSAFSAAGPFRYLDGAIQLEDMAGSPNGSDFDYNDHFWLVTTTPIPEGGGGGSGGGGGTNPPPVPPPPTTPPVPPATPTISISPFFHPTEGGIGQFNITRSTGAGALTVSYSTPTGSALEGSDYSGLDSNNRSVTFLENQTVVPVYFQAIDDTLVELPETVIAELNPVAGYTVVGGPATATITDNDDDPPPDPPGPPAPTLYAVELITPGVGGGTVANSAAVFTGQLMLNQSFASLPMPGADQRILVSAPTALEAARLALTGTIYATAGGRAMEHVYLANMVGLSLDASRNNGWSYFVMSQAATAAGANHRVWLEDMNGVNPPAPNDGDYNDRFWELKVTAIAAPAVKLEVINGAEAGLSSLKIGKWENAFNAPAVAGGAPTVKENFIGLDPDRFTIRLTDLAASAAMNNNAPGETRTVHVVTTIDAGSDITLTEEGNTGVFVSQPLLLVSNGPDNNYAVGGIPDNAALGDRTFEVRLGDNVSVQYAGNGDPTKHIEKRETVPVVKVVKLHVTILRLANGDAVISQAAVETLVRQTNEIYAQVGIRFQASYQTVNQPVGVDQDDGFALWSGFDADGKAILTAESRALIDAVKQDVPGNVSLRTAAADDVEVYFVKQMADRTHGQQLRLGIAPDASSVDSAFIGSKADTPYMTLAHEIGHILMNRSGHPDGEAGSNVVNLMAFPYAHSNSVADSRRINSQISPSLLLHMQAQAMLSARLVLLTNPS